MEKQVKGQLVEDILDGRFGEHLIRQALDAGTDPNEPASDGMTPLMAACRNCGSAEIHLLLERGANAKPADFSGRTALHFAALGQSDAKSLELLIVSGADVHAIDKRGATPLHVAAVNSEWTGAAAAECLLRHHSDPGARDRNGLRPFELAKHKQTKSLLKAAYEQRQMATDPDIKSGTPGDKPVRARGP
jgi:ankyrin repeat protein